METIEQNIKALQERFPEAKWSLGTIDHGSVLYLCSNGKEGDELQHFPLILPVDTKIDPKADEAKLNELELVVKDLLDDDAIVDQHFSW